MTEILLLLLLVAVLIYYFFVPNDWLENKLDEYCRDVDEIPTPFGYIKKMGDPIEEPKPKKKRTYKRKVNPLTTEPKKKRKYVRKKKKK